MEKQEEGNAPIEAKRLSIQSFKLLSCDSSMGCIKLETAYPFEKLINNRRVLLIIFSLKIEGMPPAAYP